jgi:hypothetical protein
MSRDAQAESSTATDTADRFYKDSPTLPEAESAPAPKSEPEQGETASGSEPEKTEPHEGKASKRIKELLAEKKRLESELEAARQEAKPPQKTVETPQFPELGQPPPKPKKEDFDDWEKYEAAKDEWAEKMVDYKTKHAVLVDRREREAAAAQRRAEEIQKTNQRLWNERETASKSRHPDFEKVVYNEETGNVDITDVPLNSTMNDFIMDSEIGPEIFYYIKKNLDEASRIAALNPVQTGRAMTKLEVELLDKIKAPNKKTTLPKPPADLGGTSTQAHKPKSDVEVMYGVDA